MSPRLIREKSKPFNGNYTERGITNMTIITILARTGILFVCSIIQVIGVIVEGISKLFGKFGEYLYALHDKLVEQLKKQDNGYDGIYTRTTDK